MHIHSEKGNVTRSKMPDMKEMSPAMRPSHSCALSSVSQRLFGLSSMIGDNWLSKCPSFMALTAIKKKRKWFQTKLAKCSMIDGWNYGVRNKWFYVDFPGTAVLWNSLTYFDLQKLFKITIFAGQNCQNFKYVPFLKYRIHQNSNY